MDNSYDPYNYTARTGTILRGLNAESLIPQCMKRNISTSVLHKLSEQELIMLGCDPEEAEELHKNLQIGNRVSGVAKITNADRHEQFLKIFKQNTQQLSVLEAYIVYCRLRLEKKYVDAIIDAEVHVNGSHVFPVCIDAALTEIRDLKQILSEKLFETLPMPDMPK